jgi:predicted DNA-binding WGR domain protein
MLRFRKSLVRRGKFLRQTTRRLKQSVFSALNRAGTPEEGSSSESEFEEFPASRDQLKARVYSLLREKARKGHKENQDELGTEVSKEDKANMGTYWKVVMKKLEVYVA